MDLEIRHDVDRQKFVTKLDGKEAYLRYARTGDRSLDFTSTFVPPEHRNRGIGERIVMHALDYARDRDLSVVPTCPFVKRVLDRHPEYASLARSSAS